MSEVNRLRLFALGVIAVFSITIYLCWDKPVNTQRVLMYKSMGVQNEKI